MFEFEDDSIEFPYAVNSTVSLSDEQSIEEPPSPAKKTTKKRKQKTTEEKPKPKKAPRTEKPKKRKKQQQDQPFIKISKQEKTFEDDETEEEEAPKPKKAPKKTAKKQQKMFSIDSDDYLPLDCIDWENLPFQNPNAIVHKSKEYISFWADKTKASPLVVGVDVGKIYISIVGIELVPDVENPLQTKTVVSHMAYIQNNPEKRKGKTTNDEYFTGIQNIILKEEFKWIWNATSYRIEQQLEVATGNMCISYGLRGMFVQNLFNREKPADVSFVAASQKYVHAPIECDHCAENEKRKTPGLTRGEKNYSARKQLSVEDFDCFLKRNKLLDQAIFFEKLKMMEDKPDDISDAFWVGYDYFKKSSQAKARKRKTQTKQQVDE